MEKFFDISETIMPAMWKTFHIDCVKLIRDRFNHNHSVKTDMPDFLTL